MRFRFPANILSTSGILPCIANRSKWTLSNAFDFFFPRQFVRLALPLVCRIVEFSLRKEGPPTSGIREAPYKTRYAIQRERERERLPDERHFDLRFLRVVLFSVTRAS